MSKRLSSDIWYHFSKVAGGKGKCNYCQKLVVMSAGSSSNLKRHLKVKHPTVSLQRTEKRSHFNNKGKSPSCDDPDEVLHEVPIPITIQASMPSTSSSSSTPLSIATTSEVSFPNSQFSPATPIQPLMSRYVESVKPMSITKSRKIDIQLLKMIAKEYHPFSLVEDPEFKEFVRMLCPNYELPSRKTLSNSLLPSIYSELLRKVKSELAMAKAVSLTTDGWTNINNSSFYAVTAHYIDPITTTLKSFLLECSEFSERHTAQNIATWVLCVLKKFEIDYKVAAVVTDNAANMKAAVSLMNFRHIACFAHSLNLAVQTAVSSSIGESIEKAKNVVQYFKKSSHALAKLHEMQEKMNFEKIKLKQDVPTRWNSTFEMLERFFKNKEAIVTTLAILGASNNLSEDDWIIIQQASQVLKQFDEVTRSVSEEKHVSLSKSSVLARLMVRRVRLELNKEFHVKIQLLLNNLLSELTERFGGRDSQELISQSVLLDPRFKKQGFQDNISYKSAYQGLLARMKASLANTEVVQQQLETALAADFRPQIETSSIWEEFDEDMSKIHGQHDPTSAAIIEIDKYVAEAYLLRTSDPLCWWESRKNVYPILYSMVVKRLCIPATSVPCERLFSKAGYICSQRRNRLTTAQPCYLMKMLLNLVLSDMIPGLQKECSKVLMGNMDCLEHQVAHLKTVGGTSLTGAIINILKRTLTNDNDVAEVFSLLGRKTKNFKEYPLYKVVFAAVRVHHKDATEKEIDPVIEC